MNLRLLRLWWKFQDVWYAIDLRGHLRDVWQSPGEWWHGRCLRRYWCRQLHSESPATRMRAAIILKRREFDPELRPMINREFEEIHDPRAVEVAARYLMRGDGAFGAAVRYGTREMKSACLFEHLAEVIRTGSRRQRRKLVRILCGMMDPRRLEPIAAAIHDPDRGTRWRAISELQSHQHPRRAEWMIEALQDPDATIREYAARTLAVEKGPGVVEALVKAAGDQDSSFRRAALRSLGSHADPRAREALLLARRDQDLFIRKDAVGALAQQGDLAAVLESLGDPDGYVRKEVIGMLADRVEDEAVAAIAGLLGDREAAVADAAQAALEKRADRLTNPTLAAFLIHADERVSGRMARVLGGGSEGAIAPLLADLASPEKAKRLAALQQAFARKDPRARPALIACLSHADADVRRQSVQALARLDVDCTEPLAAALGDGAAEVREAAAFVLATRGHSKALDYLVREARSSPTEAAMERLAQTGQAGAFSSLVELLEHPSAAVRRRAVGALARMHDRRAVAPINRARLHDADAGVRKEAESALWRLLPSDPRENTPEEQAIVKQMLASSPPEPRRSLPDPFAPCSTCGGSGKIKYADHWQKCPDCVGPTPYKGMRS